MQKRRKPRRRTMAVRRGTEEVREEGEAACWNPKKEEVEDLLRPDLIEGERAGRGRPNEEDDFVRGEVEGRRADIEEEEGMRANERSKGDNQEREALSEREDGSHKRGDV